MAGGYMPEVDTMTFQGVFNEHRYFIGEREQERLVAAQTFPLVHKGEPWLAVFLKSKLDGMPRDSTPIDLSVVIDISGIMSAAMGRGEEQQAGSRLDHAKLGVQFLVQEVLRPNDRIAVSAFNQDGHLVQPLTTMQEMIPEDFLDPVRALHTNGGTKLAAGMQIGR